MALGKIGADAVAPLMLAAPHVGEPAEITLSIIGEPAVGPVIDAIRDGNTHLVHTLGLLATMGRLHAFPALCDVAIKDSSRAARDHARVFIDTILGNGEQVLIGGIEEIMRQPVLRGATTDQIGHLANPLLDGAVVREMRMHLHLKAEDALGRRVWDCDYFPLWFVAIRTASGLYGGLYEFSRSRGYDGDDVLDATGLADKLADLAERWRKWAAADWCRSELGQPPTPRAIIGIDTVGIAIDDPDAITLMRKLMAAKVAKA